MAYLVSQNNFKQSITETEIHYHPFNAMYGCFDNLEHRLCSLFADAFDEEFNNMIEHYKPKEQKEQEKPKEQTEEKPKEDEFKKELKDTQEKMIKKIENYRPQNYYRTYSSQRHCNGNEKFE